ncbi:MAG: M48 family metallopeptidase [Clostridia bacterium]|nr:M48 family metallopeptidase [Clostridia bacterium]
MSKFYVEIEDKKILVNMRSYTNTSNLNLYFKNNVLKVSKPRYIKYKEVLKFIKLNEKEIYKQYISIVNDSNSGIHNWNTGEKIMYQGRFFEVINIDNKSSRVQINIKLEENKIEIRTQQDLDDEIKKEYIDKTFKKLLRNNTIYMISKRLPDISNKIGIVYSSFKVRDSVYRLGSCIAKTKSLNFSSRLIMFPENIVDAIIVHELCHIVHPNHSSMFYELVKKYISNYDEYDKWIKANSKYLSF